MTLLCEVKQQAESLVPTLVNSMRDITKLRAEAQLLAPGTLPNDGKVIEDKRKLT